MPVYPPEELRKRYKESKRSQTFVEHCVLVAECCVSLRKDNTDTDRYFYQTAADYIVEDSFFNFILEREAIGLHPSLCCCKFRVNDKREPVKVLQSFMLELFDASQPRYTVRKKLSSYVKYLANEDYVWMDETESDELPSIMFIFPWLSDLIYAKRKLRRLVADAWEYKGEDEPRPHIWLTTTELLKGNHIFADGIWEKV